MQPIHTLALLLGSLFGVPAAAAELVEVELRSGQSVDREFTAPPGKGVEVCGKLVKGQSLEWQFDASGPTDFNIHYHLGRQVKYPEKRSAVSASTGRLQVQLDEDHCWMWTNRGATAVTIRTRIVAQDRP